MNNSFLALRKIKRGILTLVDKSRINYPVQHALVRSRTWIICGHRYKAEINPYRVLWIQPDQITEHRRRAIIPKDSRGNCYVFDGDWDLNGISFDDHPIFIMLKEHFLNNVPWSETSFYQTILGTINERGIFWHGCRSEIEVKARCELLDRLFNEIKFKGYRVPGGLVYGETGLAKTLTPQEIIVNIDRNGKFIYETGKHRLSIAKILALPLFPVQIMIRHKLWQDLREEIMRYNSQNDLPAHLRACISHPDLAYLLPRQ